MTTDPALDFLRKDAESKGPLLIQACKAEHRHGAIPCYEVRYGVMLSQRPHEVHQLLERDRPLYASPDYGMDPADVLVLSEEIEEALAARDEGQVA